MLKIKPNQIVPCSQSTNIVEIRKKVLFFSLIPFQSLFPEPLSIQSRSVQFLRSLWEKTQAEGAHSFETAMMESTFLQQKVNAYFLGHVILN